MKLGLKEWASVLFLLITIALLVGVAYYNQTTPSTSSEAPGISISDFQLIGLELINSSGTTLLYQFQVRNPTPVGATVENVMYDMYADGNYLGLGVIDQPLKIPAMGSVLGETNFLLTPVGSIRGAWIYFLDGGQVSWKVVGNATLIQSILGILHVQFDCISESSESSISCSYAIQGPGAGESS